ncbi:MAG TPA: hypothetical protein VGK17_09005 [Propionicimonas sp.]|jgi:hypothetical protein
MPMQSGAGHAATDRAGWVPQSTVGRWAVALAGITAANVVLILGSLALGLVELPDTFSDNWRFGMWGVSIWATGMASLVSGVVAMTRGRDRSRLVLLATLLGLLPVALLISEVALGKF